MASGNTVCDIQLRPNAVHSFKTDPHAAQESRSPMSGSDDICIYYLLLLCVTVWWLILDLPVLEHTAGGFI